MFKSFGHYRNLIKKENKIINRVSLSKQLILFLVTFSLQIILEKTWHRSLLTLRVRQPILSTNFCEPFDACATPDNFVGFGHRPYSKKTTHRPFKPVYQIEASSRYTFVCSGALFGQCCENLRCHSTVNFKKLTGSGSISAKKCASYPGHESMEKY